MGMYDHVQCKHESMPEKFRGRTFQTKDLECKLRLYVIRENGTLWLEDAAMEDIDGMPGHYTFCGELFIYDWEVEEDTKSGMHTFMVRFRWGRLIELKDLGCR